MRTALAAVGLATLVTAPQAPVYRPPVETQCRIASNPSSYANGDSKITLRCPPLALLKDDTVRIGTQTALTWPDAEVNQARVTAYWLGQLLDAVWSIADQAGLYATTANISQAQQDAIFVPVARLKASDGSLRPAQTALRTTGALADIRDILRPVFTDTDALYDALRIPGKETLLAIRVALGAAVKPIQERAR